MSRTQRILGVESNRQRSHLATHHSQRLHHRGLSRFIPDPRIRKSLVPCNSLATCEMVYNQQSSSTHMYLQLRKFSPISATHFRSFSLTQSGQYNASNSFLTLISRNDHIFLQAPSESRLSNSSKFKPLLRFRLASLFLSVSHDQRLHCIVNMLLNQDVFVFARSSINFHRQRSSDLASFSGDERIAEEEAIWE